MSEQPVSFVDSLLQDRHAQLQQAEKERIAKIHAEAHELNEKFDQHVGPEYVTLLQAAGVKGTICTDHSGTRVEHITYEIPAFDDLQLAPIVIEWGRTSGNPGYYGPFKNLAGHLFQTLADCLADARKRYPDFVQRRLDKQLEPHLEALNWFSYQKAETPEAAAEHLEQLATIDPARAEKWQAVYGEWRTRFNQARKQEREAVEEATRKAQQRAEQRQKAEAWVVELVSWNKANAATLAANQTHAIAIQADNDGEYPIHLVTYVSGSALSEDGELYIEKESVYARPGADGYWILKNGNPIKYPNIASIELVQTKPSEGLYSKKVKRHGVELFFSPWMSGEYIETVLSVLIPLPDKPQGPAGLSYSDNRRCEYAAEQIAKGETVDLDGPMDIDY